MVDYDECLNVAQEKILTLEIRYTFLLKDLYSGTDWNKLSSGEKRELGRRFKYAVNTGDIKNVTYIGKAKNNSAQYTISF